LLLSLSFGVYSQKTDPEPLQLGSDDLILRKDSLETTITSASRTNKNLKDLPLTIYVVPRDEILENGYLTLVDVLKDVPGIRVSQPGSGLEGETFLMNGLFGNYYCKVLVDGIPVTPSVVSGAIITGNLPIRQAQRIEIISGPSSALYGSDALAGVINIITKESDRPVWSQADLTMGSQGFYHMNVMIGGKFGKNKNVAEYTLYGNYNQQSDFNVKYDVPGNYDPVLYDEDADQQPFYEGTANNPTFDRLPQNGSLLGFSLKYRGIKATYEHRNRRTHSSLGQNTGLFGYYDPDSFWGERIDRVAVSYSNRWDKFASTTLLSYMLYRMDNNSNVRLITDRGDEGIVYYYSASDDVFFDQLLTYDIHKNLEINGGFSFQYSGNLPKTNDLPEPFDQSKYRPFAESVNVSDTLLGKFGYNPVNFYNVAGYAQLYYSLNKLSVLAGVRWDEHELFGSNVAPRIGLQYKLRDNLSVRMNYGHGFRAPSLYYVYNSVAYPDRSADTASIIYENIPNPNVDPERFRALEIGFRYSPSKKIDLELIVLFHRLIENITYSVALIDPEKYPNSQLPVALTPINDQNSEADLIQGQINIRANDLVPSIRLGSDLFITLSKGREILPNNLGTLDDYRNMPNWMVQWNIDMQLLRKWKILLNNHFSGSWKKRFFPLELEEMERLGLPTDTDGYYALDVTNRFSINRNLHAFLIINNVFDARYGGIDANGGLYDLLYNPQRKFHFRLGFSFTME
jgi:hemoglobin/transferrin/lactoferrin receptor protein